MSAGIIQDRCWIIPMVAACCVFFTELTLSSYGLLYVLFMAEFNTSHEEAAWPPSLHVTASHTIGLLATVVQQKIPVYHMALFGALLTCASLIASSFAPNMAWTSVLACLTYGAGAGLVLLTLSLYTLVYFNKYRATATAFKYTGWSVSGVVGPSLLAYLSETYGTLPSLLLAGAIAAHAIPLLMLLENPRPMRRLFSWRKEPFSGLAEHSATSNVPNCSESVLPPHCPSLKDAERAKRGAELKAVPSEFRRGELNASTSKINDLNSSLEGRLPADEHDVPEMRARNVCSSAHKSTEQDDTNSHRSKYLVVKTPDLLKLCAAVFRSVYLYALVVSYVAIDYSSCLYDGTIVAYGLDKKAGTLNQCNQLQTISAVGQLAGRLVVPFLSDKIPFSRCPIAAGSLALSAASFVLMSLTSSYSVLSVLTIMLGVCRGFLVCVKVVLYSDYLGVESLGLACGLQGLGMAPALMTAPAVIGYFRDKMGSYDQFYWMLAALDLMAAIIVCCIALTDRQRRKLWVPS